MKNNQGGFIVPVLLAIITVLIISGGFYYVKTKKAEVSASTPDTITATTSTNNSNNTVAVEPTPKVENKNLIIPSQSELNTTNVPQISQNAKEVKDAEIKAAQLALRTDAPIDGQIKLITAPSYYNILEPGRIFTVVFAPVKNASKYEITITKPDAVYNAKNYPGRTVTLLTEVTKETTHNITVPNNDGPYLSEHGGGGGTVINVRAIDEQGNTVNIPLYSQGRKIEYPAVSKQQIKILPPPNHPQLLKADKYVVGKDGGTVTLSFGALPSNFKTRKVEFPCDYAFGKYILIDNGSCTEIFEAGQAPFTKKLTVKGNPFLRDTAFVVHVTYYDDSGKERDGQSGDNSFVSIKIGW